jgi:hypothetical protein
MNNILNLNLSKETQDKLFEIGLNLLSKNKLLGIDLFYQYESFPKLSFKKLIIAATILYILKKELSYFQSFRYKCKVLINKVKNILKKY